jgi:hypothetical protein
MARGASTPQAICSDEYQDCSGRSFSRMILRGFVTGHDFSRAANADFLFRAGFSPCKNGVCGKQTMAGAKARSCF